MSPAKKKNSTSTALATRQEEGVELQGLPKSLADAISAELAGGTNPIEMAVGAWTDVETAKTAEDILGGSNAVSSRDFLDTPFTVLGFRLWPSTFEGEGPRVFGSIDGVTAEGEPVIVNTSNIRTIVTLLGAKVRGWLPLDFEVRFVQAEHPTARGFYPVYLQRVEE